MEIDLDLKNKEKFERLLEKLPVEERLRVIEENKNVIGKAADPEIPAIALKEYLKTILAKQVKMGKMSYSVKISGKKVTFLLPTLFINEKEEIPIEFEIIATKTLPVEDVSDKEKEIKLFEELFQEYGVALRIIKGIDKYLNKYLLYGVELLFIPVKGGVLSGEFIRRPYPLWKLVDLYDEKVEKVIKLIEEGGILIDWRVIADEILRKLSAFRWIFQKECLIDWEKIEEINERLRKRKGRYYRKIGE